MNTRSLFLAAILATLGTPLVAAASPVSPDPSHVYAPLSSWRALQGSVRAERTGEDAGVATSCLASGRIRGGSAWPTPAVAIALGITPSNDRARRLYQRLGLSIAGTSMVKDLGTAGQRPVPPRAGGSRSRNERER